MKKLLFSTVFLILATTFSQNLMAQLYWGGAGGAWDSAGWSNTNSAPYTTAWDANTTTVHFNLDGNIAGPTTNSLFKIANIFCNANVTLTSPSSAATARLGNANGLTTYDISDTKKLDLSSQPIQAGTTSLQKDGLGTLAVTGTVYSGGCTLNAGTFISRGGGNGFGSGVLTINGGTIGVTQGTTFACSAVNIQADFTFGSTIAPAANNFNMNFIAGTGFNLGAATRTITLNTTGLVNINGVISGNTGSGLTIGAGSINGNLVLLNASNSYTGPTTLSGGNLALGIANSLTTSSSINFNGGTLKSGLSAGFSNNFNTTINLLNNSTLTLGTGVHSLNFNASNAVAWTTGRLLTITGWQGAYDGSSGTAGKIFVGTDATGLTVSQLAQIKFFNGTTNYDAILLSTGELVPSTVTLPISLISFNGSTGLNGNQLKWTTSSEQNNSHFEVLRSGEDKVFYKIGSVEGKGNINSISQYSFLDFSPLKETNYYILKQVDFDGKSKKYGPISINSILKASVSTLSVYGNSSDLNVSFVSKLEEQGILKCFDLNGKLILNKIISLKSGNNNFKINEFSELFSGVYIMTMETSSGLQKIKFSL